MHGCTYIGVGRHDTGWHVSMFRLPALVFWLLSNEYLATILVLFAGQISGPRQNLELNGETSGRRNFSLALVLAKVKLGMYLQVVNVCDIPWLYLAEFHTTSF